jgi:hypothetical protein
MSEYSLSTLLANLHDNIQNHLQIARTSFGHPGTKGDASENVWLKMLRDYLPQRYRVEKASVVDSKGIFSDQIDVVVFDRQYSPFIFQFEGQKIVPAESVYAIFEAKQTINAKHIAYAREKVSSVRKLHRTSLPIPHAGGTYPAKPLIPILGGILTLESDWTPCCGDPLRNALGDDAGDEDRLDLGCVAAHGHFVWETAREGYEFTFTDTGKPATAFLFKLISMLQFSGTVPMININAYAKWI